MNKVKDLERLIKYYATQYYTGESDISDEDFDKLVERLRSIDPTNKLLTTPGWGYEPRTKSKHLYSQITGLPKYKVMEDFVKGSDDITLSPKLDGISCVVYYEDGIFDKALTRGNGVEGVDISRYLVNKVPIRLDTYITIAIRGELCILQKDAKELNLEKSARNWVSGVINSNDASKDDLDRIHFIIYTIVATSNTSIFEVHHTSLLDFESVPFSYYDHTSSQLQNLYDEWSKYYIIDGIVGYDGINTNPIDHKVSSIEYLNHRALKFQSERKESVVTSISWNLSGNQKLVPVVNIEPILLNGATIKRTTGFNAQFIKRNKIGIGTKVTIERSGDIIPTIVKLRSPQHYPFGSVRCPVCNSISVWDGVDLKCSNYDCPNITKSRVSKLINLKGMVGIKGISSREVVNYIADDCLVDANKLYNDHIIDSVLLDEYNLTKHGYRDGLVSTSLLKSVLENIKNSKYNDIDIIYIANLEGISTGILNKIPSHLLHMYVTNSYFNEYDKIQETPGIGYRISQVLQDAHEFINQMYQKVLCYNKYEYVTHPQVTEVKGKVAITGKLSMTRSKFTEYLNSLGYEVGSVSKATQYLICNNPSNSSKTRKAQELGIPVVTEKEFIEYENIR